MASQAKVGNAIATAEAASQLEQTRHHGRQPGDDIGNCRTAAASSQSPGHLGCQPEDDTGNSALTRQPNAARPKSEVRGYQPADYGCVPCFADEAASSSFVTRWMNRRHLVHGVQAASSPFSADLLCDFLAPGCTPLTQVTDRQLHIIRLARRQRCQRPTVQVPPCIAGTVLGKKLADRMLPSDWLLITAEDVPQCRSGWVPVEPSARIKHERDLGLREAKTDSWLPGG